MYLDYLDEHNAPEEKEKMVILGTGWAAMSLVNALNLFRYDVTLVSPRNYFLFTPLLAEAVVGNVSAESLMEPVRNFSHGGGFEFVEAAATDIDPVNKIVRCETVVGKNPMELKYDKLVVAVGSVAKHEKVKGVENYTLPLRDLHDAMRIRNMVIDCLERANSEIATDDEKRRILHFVVVGGNAVASEAAAELHDYVTENIHASFPKLKPFFKVTIIDSKDHIHNFYDKSISKELRRYYDRQGVEILYDAQIVDISQGELHYTLSVPQPPEGTEKSAGSLGNFGKSSSNSALNASSPIKGSLPFGLCVWSTGNAIHPLVQSLRKKLGDAQQNERALVCDLSLRVHGAEDIFALGDCATVDQGMLLKKWAQIFKASDVNGDGTIDLQEYRALMNDLSRTYPALKAMDDSVFARVDVNHDNILAEEEFKGLLTYMERTLTRFPATASVAAQQGSFLADNLNKGNYDKEEEDGKVSTTGADAAASEGKTDGEAEEPGRSREIPQDNGPMFRYKHIGGYEYVGAEDGFVERGSKGQAIVTGPGAWWLWRAVFVSRVVSSSMRVHLLFDWIHSALFGSHPTRV